MSLKEDLKLRLIAIPINNKALREIHSLAEDLDVDYKKLKFYLDELCNEGILKEKRKYVCPNCGSTEVLTEELLAELLEESEEEGFINCEECYDSYDYEKHKTGYIYYDIEDYSALTNW